jgi:hypothetical protein
VKHFSSCPGQPSSSLRFDRWPPGPARQSPRAVRIGACFWATDHGSGPSVSPGRTWLVRLVTAAWDPSAGHVTHLAEDSPLNCGLRRFRRRSHALPTKTCPGFRILLFGHAFWTPFPLHLISARPEPSFQPPLPPIGEREERRLVLRRGLASEKRCGSSSEARCDVVKLFRGKSLTEPRGIPHSGWRSTADPRRAVDSFSGPSIPGKRPTTSFTSRWTSRRTRLVWF